MQPIDAEGFYDDHVPRRLRDFVQGNRRINAAVAGVVSGPQTPPRSVLEIGCGIGFVAWDLHRRWPRAQIVGVDTSPVSIDTASRLFGDSGIRYVQGRLEDLDLPGPFDLVVMMDVYEHVPVDQRASLHRAVNHLLAADGSVFVSVPTPEYQNHLRVEQPEGLQPVDEDVSAADLERFAEACDATLVSYRKITVWRQLDYAHCWMRRVPGAGSVRVPQGPWYQPVAGRVRRAIGLGPLKRRRRERRVAERLGAEWLDAARRS